MNESTHRPIRSFVMRTGRMTSGQTRALEELWPRYGVEYSPAPPESRKVGSEVTTLKGALLCDGVFSVAGSA